MKLQHLMIIFIIIIIPIVLVFTYYISLEENTFWMCPKMISWRIKCVKKDFESTNSFFSAIMKSIK